MVTKVICFLDEYGRTCQDVYKGACEKLYQEGDSILLYYNVADPQKNIAEVYLQRTRSARWKVPLTMAILAGIPIAICLLAVFRIISGR